MENKKSIHKFISINNPEGDFVFPHRHPNYTLKGLQREKITPSTKFLYFCYRDQTGFHSSWIWHNNFQPLLCYFFDTILPRAVRLEYGGEVKKEDSFPDILDFLASTWDEESKELPRDIVSLIAGAAILASKKDDNYETLNKLSEPLEETLGDYYYSVSWTFYEGSDAVSKEIKHHDVGKIPLSLPSLLRKDVNL